VRINGGVTCTCSGWDICAPAAAGKARTKTNTKTERERRENEAGKLLIEEKHVLGKDMNHPQATVSYSPTVFAPKRQILGQSHGYTCFRGEASNPGG
jgi:hypothetical protein